ncbi:MAG: AmmeMemoRadiSam system radical SAM enzyme [Planctomycetes bacterium]|nr:AmmeMemoRadiSam system radical SAM enzyme [Planctomycetota bacterium]
MKVREPALAGTWYKGKADELRKTITNFLFKVPTSVTEQYKDATIVGLVSPHAGHEYSGQCAAYGYAAIKDKSYKRVVIMGPSHHAGFKGVAVTNATHYKTPLGTVEIDQPVCQALLKNADLFSVHPDADALEHSLEIQLPFLQTVITGYKLVPLIIGDVRDKELAAVAKAIRQITDNETLVIASSDFTHYGPRFGYVPFEDNIKENLRKLDGGAIDKIVSLSADGFTKYINSTGATVCGYRPIAILLHLLPKETQANLLDYYTSGDLLGDYTDTVSYASICFTAGGQRQCDEHILDEPEQKFLLKLAREALRMHFKSGKMPSVDEAKLTPRLKQKFGVFVSLHKNKELRGCIGNFEPVVLYKAVMKQVIESATGDPRFEPMTAAEESGVHIEISVMPPMKKIHSYKEKVSFYRKISEDAIECLICPKHCKVLNHQRGTCGNKENDDGVYYSLVYSRPCTITTGDPIEKKPFFHFLPGAKTLSLATAGCNFGCKFCQNWQISQAKPEEIENSAATPEDIVKQAKETNLTVIAFTYGEPVGFYEYMLDIARLAKEHNIKTVMISNGYINEKPLWEVCKHLSAVKVDLKSFSDDFYKKYCNGTLQPVLDTLLTLKEIGIWYEIVVLLIPTLNDSEQEIQAMCEWIKDNLGADVPMHFSRFHPMYQLANLPRTPLKTLEQAHTIAKKNGLNYVYLGNVSPHTAESTYCPGCNKVVIERKGYTIGQYNVKEGKCTACGRPIPGIW